MNENTLREVARPTVVISLVTALIIGALLESFGYPISEWFKAFAISVSGGWLIERGITKRITKNGNG